MTTTLMHRSTTNNTHTPQENWLRKATTIVIRSTLTAGIALAPALAEAVPTPTNPPIIKIAAQTQEQLAVAVYQFDLISMEKEIFNFLKNHQSAARLLTAWSSMSDSIFGAKLDSKLKVILDKEANKNVLIIEVHAGIEDEQVLFSKEEKLFNLIEMRDLEDGLENVVLSVY